MTDEEHIPAIAGRMKKTRRHATWRNGVLRERKSLEQLSFRAQWLLN
jgi:hypothetical protein